jgi:hypothetical protein
LFTFTTKSRGNRSEAGEEKTNANTNEYSQKNQVSVSLSDVLRKFHGHLPLAGDPPNALLSLPDAHLSYLIAAIRNTPRSPPNLSPDGWHRFILLLQPHSIVPLIAFHIQTWPEECQPPQEIMEYLNRIFLGAAARNLLAGRQIQQVVDALNDAGIPVILLKGHALARAVYSDPALRQSSDIDLLVQPHNVPVSEEILEKLGYVCHAKIFHTSPYADHDEIFSLPGKGLNIELHWTADYAYNLFPEGWLDAAFLRRIPIKSGDLSCDTFSHTDHLLYLAFHDVFHHRSMRLDWIYDISLLMAHLKKVDDWNELGKQSVVHHLRLPMELSLTAASLWTGCELPDGVGNFSLWPVPTDRELRLFQYSSAIQTSIYSRKYLIFQGLPGIREKFWYGWHFILPPTPIMNEYRRSPSAADIPIAHLRRWFSILKPR